jgi:hypothetical protein
MAQASHELALNLRQQISERHAQNQAIDTEVREVLLRKLNCVREAGILVEEAKKNLSGRQFAEIAKDVPIESLRAYLAFSRLHTDGPITEVEKGMKSMRALTLALQTGGLLPFANNGHGLQQLRQQSLFIPEIIQAAAQLAHKLRQHLKSHPLVEWNPSDIESTLAALQPVVSVHRQLRLFLDQQ